MNREEEILALQKYAEELTFILSRFKRTRDGIYINSDDDSRFRQIAIEIRDIFDDVFGDNSYSSMVVAHFNEGISNFTGSPSYKSVENIQGIISSVVTRLERNPNALSKSENHQVEAKGPAFPEKVTVSWLVRHVPVGIWLGALGVIGGAFIAGIQTSQISFVQEIFDIKPQVIASNAKEYKSLISDIYSYKNANGPPPNAGLISVAIQGLRAHKDKKEKSLTILRSLEKDSYLTNPAFSNEYKQIMQEAKATIDFLNAQ